MDALFGFCINTQRVSANQEAHDIDIMGSQVNHHTHITDTRRKGPCPPAEDLKDPAQLAGLKLLFERLHGGVEPDDMPDHQHTVAVTRHRQ